MGVISLRVFREEPNNLWSIFYLSFLSIYFVVLGIDIQFSLLSNVATVLENGYFYISIIDIFLKSVEKLLRDIFRCTYVQTT